MGSSGIIHWNAYFFLLVSSGLLYQVVILLLEGTLGRDGLDAGHRALPASKIPGGPSSQPLSN